jgi:hypothetical protein
MTLTIIVFQDGVKWHDVGCENRKLVVCQEEPALLNLVGLLP